MSNEKNNMKQINTPKSSIPSLTISQVKLSIPAIFGKIFNEYKYERLGHELIDNCHFDVYEVESEGEKYKYYENIDSFFGKGNLLPNINERDIPTPNKPYDLDLFIGQQYNGLRDYGLKKDVDLDKIKVNFKQYSSEMVGNYIAAYYPSRNEIDVTPIKMYEKEFDYPILHSFNLYKLFIMHQVMHVLNKHDFQNTEPELKGNYYSPKIGIDCIQFKPNPIRTFSNEFINYTFWCHKPKAFNRDNEKFAFLNSAMFGTQSKLFTETELRKSIRDSLADNNVVDNLFEILDWNNKKRSS